MKKLCCLLIIVCGCDDLTDPWASLEDTGVSDTDTDSDVDTDSDSDTDTDTDTDSDSDTDSDTDTDADAGVTDCSYLTDGELNIVGTWYHCGYFGDDTHLLGIEVITQPDGCYLSFSGSAAEDNDNFVHITGAQKEESGIWPLSFCASSTCYEMELPTYLDGKLALLAPYTTVCFERTEDVSPDSGL